MRVLLLKYNKVTNESFERFAQNSDLQIVWADLASFGRKMDVLNYGQVSDFLNRFTPLDAVMVGDIFWPTGQEICHWSAEHNVRCFFLQHGQWIYTVNKESPRYLPYCTCVYGDSIRKKILSWSYGKRSRVEVTGNPRYDNLRCRDGDYIYFSPPVMLELNASSKSVAHPKHEKMVRELQGLDQKHKVIIHPHYREGKQHILRKIFPSAEFIEPEAPVLDAIADAKCVLTHRNSTVVLDAIACRKQVVLMNFSGDSYYRTGHFAPFAVESSNFEECMRNLAKEPEVILDYEKRARSHLALEGASKKIEQLIKESGECQFVAQ